MIRVIEGDCRDALKALPEASVHCCVTSPPYFGLRDYGVEGQIGLEASPDLFVAEMVAVFREVRRVLRDDATFWLNLGDSYASGGGSGIQGTGGQRFDRRHTQETLLDKRHWPEALKPKDLMMIPARVALALQADGWWLRSDIIWHKPNPMPESVNDRPTTAHEHVFLLTKSARYFYDAEAIRQPLAREWDDSNGGSWAHTDRQPNGSKAGTHSGAYPKPNPNGANARSVWTIPTHSFSEAHFATFPPALAERCIKAGTSEKGCCAACGAPWARIVTRTISLESGSGKSGVKPEGKGAGGTQTESGTYDIRMGPVVSSTTTGWGPTCACDAAVVPCTVLDPFAGAFTSLLVADRLQRDGIGIELNPAYAEMARKRLTNDAPLFAEVAG